MAMDRACINTATFRDKTMTVVVLCSVRWAIAFSGHASIRSVESVKGASVRQRSSTSSMSKNITRVSDVTSRRLSLYHHHHRPTMIIITAFQADLAGKNIRFILSSHSVELNAASMR